MIQSYFALEDLDSKAINELSRQFLINWKASKAKKKLKDERVMTGQITYPFNGERTHRCSEVGPGVRLIGVRFFFCSALQTLSCCVNTISVPLEEAHIHIFHHSACLHLQIRCLSGLCLNQIVIYTILGLKQS